MFMFNVLVCYFLRENRKVKIKNLKPIIEIFLFGKSIREPWKNNDSSKVDMINFAIFIISFWSQNCIKKGYVFYI